MSLNVCVANHLEVLMVVKEITKGVHAKMLGALEGGKQRTCVHGHEETQVAPREKSIQEQEHEQQRLKVCVPAICLPGGVSTPQGH